MNKELELLEAQRIKILSEYHKFAKPAIFFFIASAGFFIGAWIVPKETQMIATILFMVLFFVCITVGIILNSIGYNKLKPYKEAFKSKVIQTLLSEQYTQLEYDPNASMDLNVLMSTKLVKYPDRWHGEDYIAGVYKNVHFTVSEFHLEDRHTTTDSKGNTSTHYETYFRGRLFVFEFDEKFKAQIRVLEKSFMGWNFASKGFKKIETESIGFNKKFFVETTDEHHAFYIITPAMIEKIARLEASFSGNFSMLWRDNELYILVNDGKNTLEPNIKKPLTQAGIETYRKDTDMMGQMIDAFGLNRDKFMNGD